jgi:hypothetical protein
MLSLQSLHLVCTFRRISEFADASIIGVDASASTRTLVQSCTRTTILHPPTPPACSSPRIGDVGKNLHHNLTAAVVTTCSRHQYKQFRHSHSRHSSHGVGHWRLGGIGKRREDPGVGRFIRYVEVDSLPSIQDSDCYACCGG